MEIDINKITWIPSTGMIMDPTILFEKFEYEGNVYMKSTKMYSALPSLSTYGIDGEVVKDFSKIDAIDLAIHLYAIKKIQDSAAIERSKNDKSSDEKLEGFERRCKLMKEEFDKAYNEKRTVRETWHMIKPKPINTIIKMPYVGKSYKSYNASKLAKDYNRKR